MGGRNSFFDGRGGWPVDGREGGAVGGCAVGHFRRVGVACPLVPRARVRRHAWWPLWVPGVGFAALGAVHVAGCSPCGTGRGGGGGRERSAPSFFFFPSWVASRTAAALCLHTHTLGLHIRIVSCCGRGGPLHSARAWPSVFTGRDTWQRRPPRPQSRSEHPKALKGACPFPVPPT